MRVLSRVFMLVLVSSLIACGDKEPTEPTKTGGSSTEPGAAGSDAAKQAIENGRAWILSQVNEDGSIGKDLPVDQIKPATTAMAVLALIETTPADKIRGDKVIRGALDYLAKLQDDTGAVIEKTGKRNYVTAVFVSALAAARIPDYRKALVAAKDYLQNSQIAGAESDPSYGGFPYKQEQGQPADLSNGQYALEALKNAERAGEKVDPKVWERAQKLLGRMQNRSEVNTEKYARKIKVGEEEVDAEIVSGNDNGATYYAGNSKAGYEKQADGTYVARSYGSMTYALLKCLLFSGVAPDDPRVKGAVAWISDNWTVDHNPGFTSEDERMQGYYYYLHTASRALAEYEGYTKQPLTVRDANGESHDWRAEMLGALTKTQRSDGTWVNAKDRWNEGLPIIVTSYALQSLAYITGDAR